MTEAGPIPIACTGPSPAGAPCSCRSTATKEATAPVFVRVPSHRAGQGLGDGIAMKLR